MFAATKSTKESLKLPILEFKVV